MAFFDRVKTVLDHANAMLAAGATREQANAYIRSQGFNIPGESILDKAAGVFTKVVIGAIAVVAPPVGLLAGAAMAAANADPGSTTTPQPSQPTNTAPVGDFLSSTFGPGSIGGSALATLTGGLGNLLVNAIAPKPSTAAISTLSTSGGNNPNVTATQMQIPQWAKYAMYAAGGIVALFILFKLFISKPRRR